RCISAVEQVAGHGILHGQSRYLYGLTRQQAYAGNGGSEGIPSVNAMGLDVAAGDGDIAASRDFPDEGWQQLRRMLQVGINYAQQVGIGVGPSERDSPGPILVGPVRTEPPTPV